MKKILFLHDPLSPMPASLLSSLTTLAAADHSYIKVLLMGRPYFYGSVPYYDEPTMPLTASTFELSPQPEELNEEPSPADKQQQQESLQQLENTFTTAGIKHSISEDTLTLEEVLKESAYADLIIADALLNFPGPFYPTLNVSVREVLTDAHCPVLLLREGDTPPDRIILSYDGSYSSMQAIRAFTYLFPHLRNIPTYIIHIAAKEQKEPDGLHYLKDWLPLHFANPLVEVLPGDPADVLPAIANKFTDSALVVMGAYGRSGLSRLFHQSLANSVLEKTKASLFVTHER